TSFLSLFNNQAGVAFPWSKLLQSLSGFLSLFNQVETMPGKIYTRLQSLSGFLSLFNVVFTSIFARSGWLQSLSGVRILFNLDELEKLFEEFSCNPSRASSSTSVFCRRSSYC